jgi:predicted ATPase
MLGDLIATIEQSGEHWTMSETHRQLGNLLRQRGVNDLAKAEAAFLTALPTGQRQKARVFELRAALDLAALFRDLDQRPRTRFVLEPTLLKWPHGVELREVGQARQLFSSLQ